MFAIHPHRMKRSFPIVANQITGRRAETKTDKQTETNVYRVKEAEIEKRFFLFFFVSSPAPRHHFCTPFSTLWRVDLAPPVSVSTGVPRGENNGREGRGKRVAEHTEKSKEEKERGMLENRKREMLEDRMRGIWGGSPILGKSRVQCRMRVRLWDTETLREHPTFWRIIVSLITVWIFLSFWWVTVDNDAVTRSVSGNFLHARGMGGLIYAISTYRVPRLRRALFHNIMLT